MRGRSAGAGLLAAALLAAGCGSEDFPNEPRPPVPVELSAKVDNRKVTVVPNEVGAGLATFTVANQSRDDVALALEGPGSIRVDEIPAGGVDAFQVELETGEYVIEASVPTISSGEMTVGPERPSAQNVLELP
jgi:hypothetical protein